MCSCTYIQTEIRCSNTTELFLAQPSSALHTKSVYNDIHRPVIYTHFSYKAMRRSRDAISEPILCSWYVCMYVCQSHLGINAELTHSHSPASLLSFLLPKVAHFFTEIAKLYNS